MEFERKEPNLQTTIRDLKPGDCFMYPHEKIVCFFTTSIDDYGIVHLTGADKGTFYPSLPEGGEVMVEIINCKLVEVD